MQIIVDGREINARPHNWSMAYHTLQAIASVKPFEKAEVYIDGWCRTYTTTPKGRVKFVKS